MKWLTTSLTITLLTGNQLIAQRNTSIPTRPNIILIIADDLGYGDVGFNGQQKIKTPNLDRLAANGLNLTQFYAGTSVCAPSRSSLMTGQHTGHTYIRGNKSVGPEGQEPIPDSVVTVAEVLKSAGYVTGAFGKWGLGPVGTSGDPNRQGFDQFYGYNSQTVAHRYYPPYLNDNDKKVVLEANGNLEFNKTYAPDLIQKEALSFIDTNGGKQPFFLFLPHILPHAELIAPDDSLLQYYKGKFPEKPFKGNDYGPNAKMAGYASQENPHATYAAMVTRLDLYVGQVMTKLREKGLDKNTIILFSSDNGPHKEGGAEPPFFNSSGGWRGIKRDLYEGGIRMPTVAYWPGVIKPGKSDYPGAFWDILPTFAELAGVKKLPFTDGISFVSTLTGKGKQRQHEFLYWEFHEFGGRQAVRQGTWKAIRLNVDDPSKTVVELYDLATDPQEKTNVAAANPEKLAELIKLIDQSHWRSTLFPFGNEQK